MLNFIKDAEFILDNKKTDGILIIDMNSQNILSPAGEVFKDNFPKTYNKVVGEFCSGNTLYNKAVTSEERGFKIVVLVGQMCVIGPDKDEVDDVIYVTSRLIEKVTQQFEGCTFHSPMLYNNVEAWDGIKKFIKKNNYNWNFYAR